MADQFMVMDPAGTRSACRHPYHRGRVRTAAKVSTPSEGRRLAEGLQRGDAATCCDALTSCLRKHYRPAVLCRGAESLEGPCRRNGRAGQVHRPSQFPVSVIHTAAASLCRADLDPRLSPFSKASPTPSPSRPPPPPWSSTPRRLARQSSRRTPLSTATAAVAVGRWEQGLGNRSSSAGPHPGHAASKCQSSGLGPTVRAGRPRRRGPVRVTSSRSPVVLAG